MKIKVGRYNYANDDTPNIWDYFCNNNCLFSFLGKFVREVANIKPVKQPSETPIKVKKEKYESQRYRHDDNGNYQRVPYIATRTTIQKGDND